jgi:hypothetical protein
MTLDELKSRQRDGLVRDQRIADALAQLQSLRSSFGVEAMNAVAQQVRERLGLQLEVEGAMPDISDVRSYPARTVGDSFARDLLRNPELTLRLDVVGTPTRVDVTTRPIRAFRFNADASTIEFIGTDAANWAVQYVLRNKGEDEIELKVLYTCPTSKVVLPVIVEHSKDITAVAAEETRVLCTWCGPEDNAKLVTAVVGAFEGKAVRSEANTSRCFIATAVYGPDAVRELMLLRRVRDEVLTRTVFGRSLVRTYERRSPPVAAWLQRRRWAAAGIRCVLDRLVSLAERRIG